MADSIVEEPTSFFASSSSTLSSQEEHHQEEEQPQEEEQEQPSSPATTTSMIFLKIISKRRTWVCLFVCVYTLLLALSWNFLKSVLSWYELTMLSSSSEGERVTYYSSWAALYGSMLLGLAFGVLSMVAALAVVVPATLVTWISILVLLTFFGKPRRALVLEGKKITIDIIGFVLKVLIKEGNIVAALCAVLGYFAFVRKSKEDGRIPSHAAAAHL